MKTENCTPILNPFPEQSKAQDGRWTAGAYTSVACALRPVVNAIRKVLDVLLDWQERASQRHALASLDDRALRDIGLSRADVVRETSKPFWM